MFHVEFSGAVSAWLVIGISGQLPHRRYSCVSTAYPGWWVRLLNCSVPAVSSLVGNEVSWLPTAPRRMDSVHFQNALSALGRSASPVQICKARATYIYFDLLPIRVLNRGVVALDPDILDELCFEMSDCAVPPDSVHTGETALSYSTYREPASSAVIREISRAILPAPRTTM